MTTYKTEQCRFFIITQSVKYLYLSSKFCFIHKLEFAPSLTKSGIPIPISLKLSDILVLTRTV